MSTPLQTAYSLLVGAVGIPVVGSVAYMLTLLGAAGLPIMDTTEERDEAAETESSPMRLTVVIPAHNEELVLAATLASLKAQDYPADRFKVVVVADNCTDATARIARRSKCSVMERHNEDERGKGYALQWAIAKLLRQSEPPDALVIVDADTWVAPDFLTVMARRLAADMDENGLCALQGRYGVLNQTEGWRAALMTGAFDLCNHVRPLGRERLGLSVGLKGNGMAFTRALATIAPWSGDSITEDIAYGLELLRSHGVRVGYVPDALVRAQMPVTADQAASQRERWERGRWGMLRDWALPLMKQGIRRRDFRLCDAAVELMLPPLAELSALLAVWGILIGGGAALHLLQDPEWFASWGASAAGLLLYILAGLRLSGAPKETYTALLRAPGYALWKFALLAGRLLRGRAKGAEEWVRTARAPIASESVTPADEGRAAA